ncbi:MAG: ferredoxin, partial [Candidatus Nanoarchaeia archaeon]
VNKEKCIGCGSCASICSKSFEMKDGKAVAKQAEVDEITCEKQAEAACPVDAISIS